MRLRHEIGAEEKIAEDPRVLKETDPLKGAWHEHFGNSNPIYVEIGMGKGRFVLENAIAHPERNHVGIEKYATIMLRALRLREEPEYKDLPNVQLLCMNAEGIDYVFAQDEVDGIFLNFSDPWPKERYAKRRLTSCTYLKRYEKIMKAGGILEFKTDNRSLFDYSLTQIQEAGWELLACTFDLHNDAQMCEGNIMTEYEEKFSEQGNPICKLIARRP